MNSVHLIGNITRDPEIRRTNNGVAVCNFDLAVPGYQNKTNFIKCVAWKGLAESLTKYIKVGNKLGVSGKLESTSYERDGVTHYGMEVVCESIDFIRTAPRLEDARPY